MTATAIKISRMAARRDPPKNPDDPRGRFAAYLRAKLDTGAFTLSGLAESTGFSERTIRQWSQGICGPAFGDLDAVATALGFDDWGKLGNAVAKFHAKK